MKLAFLGLGVMGFPMAGHLAGAGHEVTVWNRTASKAKAWAGQYDGVAADTIAAAVSGADFVMMCVGDSPDVIDVSRAAQLTIMCGGDKADYERSVAVMQPYAKATTLMGESGAGQLTKMVNQICIAGILQGLSEGVNFAQKAGLDVGLVVEAIGKGAAQSWQMLNRAETMAKD